uniref:Endonuclease n=1 Tax=Ophiognomonia clavigignenti-juglandacearum TaxID=218668 RepID=A0A2C9DSC3_9PEZI|nr:endonuclease [Ophiognomonia clavigignenti-juglandacearum]
MSVPFHKCSKIKWNPSARYASWVVSQRSFNFHISYIQNGIPVLGQKVLAYSTFNSKDSSNSFLSSSNDDITPAIVYQDAYSMKKAILMENKGKGGIYMWTNKLTGDIYVGQSKAYSTSTYSKSVKENDFYEWFCGLTDGEGCFLISTRGINYTFAFKLGFHVDDTDMLNFIHKFLGIGKVYTYGKVSTFLVNQEKEVKNIISIFDNYPLNSTKYLNFLAFKKAFELYTTCNDKSSADIVQGVAEIRSSMNKSRFDFEMPKDKQIRITPYWLLGFVEGEGSFYVEKKYNFVLGFALTQGANDLALMEKIQIYFRNLSSAGLPVNPKVPNYNTGVVSISTYKRESGSYVNIIISRTDFILDVLTPFFDSMNWHSKKYMDYQDWKAILKLKQLGLQYLPEGLKIIKLIVSQMNNKRLSSNSSTKIDRESLYGDINRLLSEPSNYEVKKNGSVFIKSLNRYISLKARDKVSVEVQDENGNIINKFDSITSCAKFYDISRSTTHRRLRNNEPVVVFIESKPFYVKLINLNNDLLDYEEASSSLTTEEGESHPESGTNCCYHSHISSSKSNLKVGMVLSQSPVNIYEKCSGEGFKLIGSFVSARRAGNFLGISGSTIIKYRNSGAIFKDRYKFSSR